HKGAIDVASWGWGASQAGTFAHRGGSGAGKVSMQDFRFSAKVSKASPTLMLACASGQHFPKAGLTCRKAGGKQEEYLKYSFTDLLVNSYQIGGNRSGNIPSEQFSLNFARVEHAYKAQKADGTLDAAVKTGWDRKANKKL